MDYIYRKESLAIISTGDQSPPHREIKYRETFPGQTLLLQLFHSGRGDRGHPLQGRVQRREGRHQRQLRGESTWGCLGE